MFTMGHALFMIEFKYIDEDQLFFNRFYHFLEQHRNKINVIHIQSSI